VNNNLRLQIHLIPRYKSQGHEAKEVIPVPPEVLEVAERLREAENELKKEENEVDQLEAQVEIIPKK
jgi:diadenosine tetraphosphate (Ap4A) HIT family hydrolase